MSAYATADAVRLAANPQWRPGSPEPDAGAQDASSLSDAQLQQAITEASAIIDSFIGARYATPVAAIADSNPTAYPDPLIASWAVDIALYRATLTFHRNMPMDPADPVVLRYAAAVLSLTSVRDGKSVLALPGPDTPVSGGTAGLADPGSAGLFDAADAGYHPGILSDGVRRWDYGGYLYG